MDFVHPRLETNRKYLSVVRMLISCPLPWVDPKFGASRVALDLLNGFERNGIVCDFFPNKKNNIGRVEYADVLADYLIEHAHEYDVVDYPFHVRSWIQDAPKAQNTLKVARVVLLPHFEDKNPDPSPPETLVRKGKRIIKTLLGQPQSKLYSPEIRATMDRNMLEADLINVANSADRTCLIELGFDANKIAVFPYGLTADGAKALEKASINRTIDLCPRVAFVGTFDFRKGCLDFPAIVESVASEIPSVKFRLLGTKGMMQTREKVLSWFPRKLHSHLEIFPTFEPSSLPKLLAECSVGMFPSYREGFGIAVVEMLGAGLPVIAYNAPGPCDILPDEWLVVPGAKHNMAQKLVGILQQAEAESSRHRALETSAKFNWDEIAIETYKCYQTLHQQKVKIQAE